MALRMEQHKKNALAVALYLENHPKVEKVLHPGKNHCNKRPKTVTKNCLAGLPSHPQHQLFKRQTSGHSGTFSFYLKGNLDTSKTFLTSLKVFALAESLGGYESLIELPYVLNSLKSRLHMKSDDVVDL